MAEEDQSDEDDDKVATTPFPWISFVMLLLAIVGYAIVSRHNVSFGMAVPAFNAVALLAAVGMACRRLSKD